MKNLAVLLLFACGASIVTSAQTARPLLWNAFAYEVNAYLNHLPVRVDVSRWTVPNPIVITRIQLNVIQGTEAIEEATGNAVACPTDITLRIANGTTDVAALGLPSIVDPSKPPANDGSNFKYGTATTSAALSLYVPAGSTLHMYFGPVLSRASS